jgi:hypothetical protein
MNPDIIIPATSAIQVDWSIFTVLLLVTFLIHIWMMNIMLGTGIIALMRHFDKNQASSNLSHTIASHLPFTIAFTINFGVAPLLFLQVLYGHLIYTSSILMAVYWLSVIGVLILAYYSAYIYDFKYEILAQKRIFFIGATVVGLLWIAFIFTNNMTLMLVPEKWQIYFEHAGGRWLNLSEKTLLPRYFHFIAASIALGGLAIALYRQIQKDQSEPADSNQASQWDDDIQTGLGWFIGASLVQMIVGVWYFLSLPESIRQLFMGNHTFGTTIFLLAIPLIILMLVCGVKNNVWMTTFLIIPVTVIMVLMRHLVRTACLSPHFRVQDLQVTGQYSPFLCFILALIAGIVVIVYMIRQTLIPAAKIQDH